MTVFFGGTAVGLGGTGVGLTLGTVPVTTILCPLSGMTWTVGCVGVTVPNGVFVLPVFGVFPTVPMPADVCDICAQLPA